MILTRRRDPFSEFDQFVESLFNSAGSWSGEFIRRGFNEIGATKVFNTDERRVIKVALPGVSNEEISLDLKDDILMWKVDQSDESAGFVSQGSGSFYVGNDLDATKTNADLSNGVLTIMIPFKEESEGRRIEVSNGAANISIEGSGTEESDNGTSPDGEKLMPNTSISDNIKEGTPSSGGKPDPEEDNR